MILKFEGYMLPIMKLCLDGKLENPVTFIQLLIYVE